MAPSLAGSCRECSGRSHSPKRPVTRWAPLPCEARPYTCCGPRRCSTCSSSTGRSGASACRSRARRRVSATGSSLRSPAGIWVASKSAPRRQRRIAPRRKSSKPSGRARRRWCSCGCLAPCRARCRCSRIRFPAWSRCSGSTRHGPCSWSRSRSSGGAVPRSCVPGCAISSSAISTSRARSAAFSRSRSTASRPSSRSESRSIS